MTNLCLNAEHSIRRDNVTDPSIFRAVGLQLLKTNSMFPMALLNYYKEVNLLGCLYNDILLQRIFNLNTRIKIFEYYRQRIQYSERAQACFSNLTLKNLNLSFCYYPPFLLPYPITNTTV